MLSCAVMPGINPKVLKDSLAAVADSGPEVVEYFYGRLFAVAAARQQPEVIRMFPLLMDYQRDRLLNALVSIVSMAAEGNMSALTSYLEDAGHDHRMISGLKPAHFGPVGEALLATLAQFAGPAWTPETAETWGAAYDLIAEVMIKAMEDDGSPRWWDATVSSSRMLSPGVLGITVQLDQPAQWLPGQSVKAEITRPENAAPAVRRYLTPVNDPAPEGSTWMEFHIAVVPWGLFSGPLARRASGPGAALRLSAPVGTLCLREGSRRNILMLAGSTGLSPMLSMISRISRWQDPPGVSLYFGARNPEELYLSRELEGMASSFSWLDVTYAVDAPPEETPGYQGRHGNVVDAALSSGQAGRNSGWADHEVYACGPQPMVRAAARRLQESGLPAEQLHTETYGTD